MKKLNIAVLFGGRSLEHEISVISALQLIKAMDSELYNIIPLYVALSGKWYTGDPLYEKSFYSRFNGEKEGLEEVLLLGDPNYRGVVKKKKFPELISVDVFFLAFHGMYGETGAVQGLLELADHCYVGADVLGSALSMNKKVMKNFVKGLGIDVVESVPLYLREWDSNNFQQLKEKVHHLGYPLFVKPNFLGSSVGISKCKTPEDLGKSLAKVFKYDTVALVEKSVEQLKEINVSVFRHPDSHQGVVSSVVEIPVSSGDEGLTYEDKYLRGGGKKSGEEESSGSGGMASLTRLIDPKDLDPNLRDKVKSLGEKIYREMDLSGAVRFDFMVDLQENNKLYFNELNSIPGSFSYYLWEQGDCALLYTELIDLLIQSALKRRKESLRGKREFGFKALR